MRCPLSSLLRSKTYRALLLLVGGAAACGSGSKDGADPVRFESTSAVVSSAYGGTVIFTDGTGLVVPAGALAADTTITLSRPGAGLAAGKGGTAGVVWLEPDGLALSAPARLVIAYDVTKVSSVDDLFVAATSRQNDLVRGAGEVNPFQVMDGTIIDGINHQATVDITHFSWYSVLSLPKMNLGLEIPGKYLHNGDILYALTDAIGHNNGSGVPMHVGMYTETGTNDRVVESTLPSSDCTPEWLEGVDIHEYEGAKGFRQLCGAHIFLGARRPPRGVTTASRAAAVDAALSRRGKPYGIIGLNNSEKVGIIAGGISCVELVEDSWEDAGVNISLTPDELLWPHDQFWNTVPVDRVAVKRGEKLVVPLVGAYRVDKTHYRTGGTAGGMPMEITVSATPDVFAGGRASLQTSSSPQGLKDLVFTPSLEDENTDVVFTLNLAANGESLAPAATLTVEVEPGEDVTRCTTDQWIALSNTYLKGTWTGKANGTAFGFANAEASISIPYSGLDGGLEFWAQQNSGSENPGWVWFNGYGIFGPEDSQPGNTFTLQLPFGASNDINNAAESMTCEGITVFGVNRGSTVQVTVDPDCGGFSLSANLVGVGAQDHAGTGKTCTVTGTFSARVP